MNILDFPESDYTAWMLDADEAEADLADIILAQLEVSKELEGENESI